MSARLGVQGLDGSGTLARLRRMLAIREAGVLLALLLMGAFLTLTTETFLTSRNLLNIGRQVSVLGIMALGMTYLLITAEIDLSIGSVFAMSSIVTGQLLLQSWGLLPAIGAGLVVGTLLGLANGLLSTYGRLPSFIATLGTLSAVRGFALIITDGQPVTVNARHGGIPEVIDQFYYLGQGRLFDQIPMQLVFFVLVIVITWIVLSRTTFGFRLYAVGGNPKAARVSGIRVSMVKIWAFVIMGFLSGMAGILESGVPAQCPGGTHRRRRGAGRHRGRRGRRRGLERRGGHRAGDRPRRADHRRPQERVDPAGHLALLAGSHHRHRDHHRRGHRPLDGRSPHALAAHHPTFVAFGCFG